MSGATITLGLGVALVRIVALAANHPNLAASVGVGESAATAALGWLRGDANPKAVAQAGQRVAQTFDQLLDVEFRHAQPHDRAAAVTALTELLARELQDPQRLVDAIRADDMLREYLMQNGGQVLAENLGGEAASVFRFLLSRAADEVARLAPLSPHFQSAALTRLIRSIDFLTDGMAELLDRPLHGVAVSEVVATAITRVRELAPADLKNRESELARMRHFALHGPGQWWGWEAPMQSGKTALMATYASQHQPGVEIVPFFVRSNVASARDRQAFLGEVLPRLAHIANEHHVKPAAANPVHEESDFRTLLARAARTCLARPQPVQLLLLIDGLDEDDWYADKGHRAGSIAGLLPARLPANVRVLVACRPNPPLPDDVLPGADVPLDERHPLRDRSRGGPWRVLSASPDARQSFDRADVVDFMSTQVGEAVAAHLVAAGGPLTVANLAQLTKRTVPGATEAQVRDRFLTTHGRLVIPVVSNPARPDVTAYELAHARIAQHVLSVLDESLIDYGPDPDDVLAWTAHGRRLLAPWREGIMDWASSYSNDRWPATSPDYLLDQGYVELLSQGLGSQEELTDVLTDAARHHRIRTRSGSFAPALAQLRIVLSDFLPSNQPRGRAAPVQRVNLKTIGRLLFALHDLTRETGRVPADLPSALARAGEYRRAERLIDATEDPIAALVALALAYLDAGDVLRCTHAAEQVLLRLTPSTADSPGTAEKCAQLAQICAQVGAMDSARSAANVIPVSVDIHQNTLTAAVVACAAAQQRERSLQAAGFLDLDARFHALQQAARACHHADNAADALDYAAKAHGLVDELHIEWRGYLPAMVRLHADLGYLDRARSVAMGLTGRNRCWVLTLLAERLLDHGKPEAAADTALEAAAYLREADTDFDADKLANLAAVLIKVGNADDAIPVLTTCSTRLRATGHARLAAAYLASRSPERAREHLDKVLGEAHQRQGWRHVLDLAALLDALIPVAPAEVLDEVILEFRQTAALDLDDIFVRNAGIRIAARLAHIGRLGDALPLAEQLLDKHQGSADEITLAVAHALASSSQWKQALNVLKSGEPAARHFTTIADALARSGHLDGALDAANQALQTTNGTPRHEESFADVAQALASIDHLPAALEIIAQDSVPHRYDGYLRAAHAAAQRNHEKALATIRSLVPEHPGSIPLLTGLADAALSQGRPQDAAPILVQAAELVLRLANQDNVRAATDIACMQAYAKDAKSATELITQTVHPDEQSIPLARVAGILAAKRLTDDARATAALAVDQVTNLGDAARRIHILAALTKWLTPHPDLSEHAQAAADAARVMYQQLPAPASPNSDAARSSRSRTASVVAEAQALIGNTESAVDICTEVRSHGLEPSAFSVAPALAAGGDVTAAVALIGQLRPSNQSQPMERVIAAVTKTHSPDDALGMIAKLTDDGQRAAALNNLAAAHASQGRTNDAHEHAKAAIFHAEQAHSYIRAEQLVSSARILERIGAHNEARSTALAAAQAAHAQHARISGAILLASAQLLRRLGDDLSSRHVLAESWVADGHPLNGWTLLAELDPDVVLALARARWPESFGSSQDV